MSADGDESMHDASITGINITPLVDVTLVLLIVFLVTTKMSVALSIPLDIPRGANRTATQTVLAVAIDAAGTISVDGKPLASDELVRVASAAHARDKDVRAVIRAAETASHGSVVRAIDALRSAEVTQIAFARRSNE